MIDKAHIGREFPAHSVAVEAGRLRFFAKATGQTDPVYLDEAAARDAGYRSLPVPPTFLFSLEVEQPDPFAWFNSIGLDLAKVLHGEQLFTYHAPACAGDVLTFSSRISDVYDKKGGALDFVVKETKVTNQDGVLIADLRATIVQRNA